jgi:hypothetical protein
MSERSVSTFTENPPAPRRIVGLIEVSIEAASKPDRLRVLDEQLEYLRGRMVGELEKIPIVEDSIVEISPNLEKAMHHVRKEYLDAIHNDRVLKRAHPDLCQAISAMVGLMSIRDVLHEE